MFTPTGIEADVTKVLGAIPELAKNAPLAAKITQALINNGSVFLLINGTIKYLFFTIFDCVGCKCNILYIDIKLKYKERNKKVIQLQKTTCVNNTSWNTFNFTLKNTARSSI